MDIKRRYFHQVSKPVILPDLIQIQTQSYQWFFEEGLREILDEISPVDDFTGKQLSLEFGKYWLEAPKYDEITAREKNQTYQAALKCQAILIDKVNNRRRPGEIFLGEFPLMTSRGTFIINGIERVVVNQIIRSYGVIFNSEIVNGRQLFGAKIIPTRGAWLEWETSAQNIISVKIDRKRKIPFTTFLRVLGLTADEEVKKIFNEVNFDKERDYIEASWQREPAKTYEDSLVEIYKRIRPGDLVTPDSAKQFLEAMFFNPKRYDLGRVGRYRFNQRLNLQVPNNQAGRILRLDDVIAVIKEIIRLNNDSQAQPDDIDHLRNRRVRASGELVQARARVGFLRLERNIKDRMSMADLMTVTPAQLVNSRPISAVIQEFFASSQLSQFMNQTNPLAELEHKRCLSATGPGGLSRQRAGFEVRDVHSSHYGRICPIETPEGPNIGLVGYLACYAKVNPYGFIETPYRLASQPKEVKYYDADAEEEKVIASELPKDNKTICRYQGRPVIKSAKEIDLIDVAPQQTVSVTAALIPFIEHDDAVRASMGSNMQRQSVPLIKPEAPLVGTGMEAAVAAYSGQLINAPADGKIIRVDAQEITFKPNRGKEIIYQLAKFVRSNQATCINQRPLVVTNQKVKKGQLLADGSATDQGELALGRNLLVAFISYQGANFEDAIIISERLVAEDILTSIHIEKYLLEVRDTKLGPEIVTCDIPNVGEDALRNLDEKGIVRIGAEVKSNDILVGKVSPKGETELTAEEKLLWAIFGEKAKDVKDSSLRLPHGEHGKIIGVKAFSKDKGDELPAGVYEAVEVTVAQLRKIAVGDKLAGRHGNKGVIAKILPVEDMPYLDDGTPVDIILNPLGVISRMNLGQILETHFGWAAEKLDFQAACPVFEGPDFAEIKELLKKAGLPEDGKSQLYDPTTGLPLDRKATVGKIYMLKLCHLVDDKMHARSTGPYSMITQQPLGGKAQFGGQRFGEMEVWALEAYGAAHTLQEMLTIKSDDVIGRSKAYEAIIRGDEIQKPSIPASFFVLVNELRSLGLNMEMITADNERISLDQVMKQSAERHTRKITRQPGIIKEETEEITDKETTEFFSQQEENPPQASEKEKAIVNNQ